MSACGWSRRHCSLHMTYATRKRPAGSPLHDVRQHAGISTRDATNSNSVFHGRQCWLALSTVAFRLVEPVGIEPTTSCLQSTRSPS